MEGASKVRIGLVLSRYIWLSYEDAVMNVSRNLTAVTTDLVLLKIDKSRSLTAAETGSKGTRYLALVWDTSSDDDRVIVYWTRPRTQSFPSTPFI